MTDTTENKASFLARVLPLLSPSDVRRVELAYILAKHSHRFDQRNELDAHGKKVRYFEHVRHVAIILIEEAGCMDADEICTALLHDTLEDTELSAETIEQFLGARVCRMVLQLSKLPKEGYYERMLKYAHWRVMRIKMCDNLHNMRSLPPPDDPFTKKQREQTKKSFPPLFERCGELIPESCRPVFESFSTIFWETHKGLYPPSLSNQL